MHTAIEIHEIIQKHTNPSEPEFLRISSPVNPEEGWAVELVWAHHDGDIEEEIVCDKDLDVALKKMKELVEKYYDKPTAEIPGL